MNTATSSSSKAIIIIAAIITLIMVNLGIFYTVRLTNQTNTPLEDTSLSLPTSKLNKDAVSALDNRTTVNIDSELQPFTSGRANPFAAP